MSSFFILSCIAIVLLAGILSLELIARYTKFSDIIIRKAGHTGLALLIVDIALYIGKDLFFPIGLSFTVIAFLLRQLPLKSLGPFKSTSYGEVLFPLGVGLSALITTNLNDFIISVLILGLADTAAHISGVFIHSLKLVGDKTLAGTIAFAIISLIIILIGTGSVWAFVIAPVIAIVELVSRRGSDNLTIPVTASLLLYLVNYLV
jgi:dolichol kinase